MKRTILSAVTVFAIFGLGVVIGTMKSQPVAPSVALAAPAPWAEPMPNRCPRIHEAVMSLDHALDDLRSAGHDFCGHKRDAMEAVRHAREQLHLAEDCDRCR
jgi:hypothetical protein